MKLAYLQGASVISVGQVLTDDEAQKQPSNGWYLAPDWVMPGHAYYDESTAEFKHVPSKEGHVFDYENLELVEDLEGILLKARLRRKQLFAETEWVRARASDQGIPVSQEWLDYWQALRDITEDPLNIVWPEKPEI